eukprot:TRINITY_DN5441_c0_g2_i1.p1 TRINITY_DN5441_c0_g2~~TRINITY_DN5441_c0_g2_i1.p1  ORF type:complete len:568 (-),score=87.51 TRINITY_DN5441_c0_g2_i1:212-1807(-)
MNTISIPKQVIIDNGRLACLQHTLTALCVAFVLFSIINSGGDAWNTKVTPIGLGISMWRAFPNASEIVSTPSWCSPAELTALGYNDGSWDYKPTACRPMPAGESLIKMGQQLYFPTFLWDTHVTTGPPGSCGACNGPDETLHNNPTACECHLKSQYLARDVDRQYIVFNHGYKVELEGEEDKATSASNTNIKTVFKPSSRAASKKMSCSIGGKNEHGLSPSGIKGTVEEFLSCAGVRLNDISVSPGLHSPLDTPHHPPLRLTGLVLKMTLNYMESHDYKFDGVICEVTIVADEVWNTMNSMAYGSVPGPAIGAAGNYRYRYQFGVSISTEVVGTFQEFNYNQLTNFIVSQMVILSLPKTIVTFVALLAVGVLSAVYQAAANQKLVIKKRIAGFCTRLMGHTETYKKITGSEKVDFVMNAEQIQSMLKAVFHAQMQSGELDEKEVAGLTATVMEELDQDGKGQVTAENFLNACTGNEDITVSAVAALFDKDRSPGIGERIFGNIRPSDPSNKVAPADEGAAGDKQEAWKEEQ